MSGSYILAIAIFFIIMFYLYDNKHLSSGWLLALIPVLAVIPYSMHQYLPTVTNPLNQKIKELQYKMATLDPITPDIINTCKPNKTND